MILPAILETDPKKQLQRIEDLSKFSNLLHTDIMDGKFVKKSNVGMLRVLARLQRTVDWELHLMVQNPGRLYSDVRRIRGVRRVVLPLESDWKQAIGKYKKYYQVGLALRPETPISYLYNLPLKIRGIKGVMKLATHNSPQLSLTLREGKMQLDFIQLLSVTPGAQGNSFHSNVYQRVRELKKLFPKLRIEIDGAMNPARIRKLKALGANDFVVGSYLKEGNVARRAALLRGF